MKKTMLLLSGLLLFSCSTELELVSSDIPQAVNAAFQAKYPGASDVEWEAEKHDGYLVFEAEFEHDSKHKEALFKPDGSFVKED